MFPFSEIDNLQHAVDIWDQSDKLNELRNKISLVADFSSTN